MIDIHCHILPGFDDGSENMAESIAMARMALDSGVTGIVVTPHFRGEERSLEVLQELFTRYQLLEQRLQREGIPVQLYPGAEILCMPQTVELARRHMLPTLGDTDYVLTEFFFDTPFEFMDALLDSIARQGYRPVIAHPERYEAIIAAPRDMDRWFRKGYIIQLNKGSILGAFGHRVQSTAEWILGNGLAHVVASDAHSARRRTTDMTMLRQRLLDRCPEPYVRVLMEENPKRLLLGQGMVPAG